MEDNQIIDLYFSRSQSAIAETNTKYGNFLGSIAMDILHSSEDTEECKNDTYMKAWNTIPPVRPLNFRVFLAKIIRNTALNIYEKYNAVKRGTGQTCVAIDELAECIPSDENIQKDVELAELTSLLNRFLSALSDETRDIFVQRYWYFREVSDIAEEFGCTEAKVYKTIQHTRKKLRVYLQKEGVEI